MSLQKNIAFNKVSTGWANRNQTNTWINSNNVACFNANSFDNYGRIACQNSLPHLKSPTCHNPLDRVTDENGNRPSISSNLLNTFGIKGDTINHQWFSKNSHIPQHPGLTGYPAVESYTNKMSYHPDDLKPQQPCNNIGANDIAITSQNNRMAGMMQVYLKAESNMKNAGMV